MSILLRNWMHANICCHCSISNLQIRSHLQKENLFNLVRSEQQHCTSAEALPWEESVHSISKLPSRGSRGSTLETRTPPIIDLELLALLCDYSNVYPPHLRFPFRLVAAWGPCILEMSRFDSFRVPPANLPTPGTSTARSLRVFFDFFEAFSRMTPFSLASLRLRASFRSAFFAIPTRCVAGIFCCVNTDCFAPRACNLISSAICLCLPGCSDAFFFSSKCDSLSNR